MEVERDSLPWASIRCSANWEVDGRGIMTDEDGMFSQADNLTRRIHIHWSDPQLEDSYIVLLTLSRHAQPNSDAPRSWGPDHLFLARPLDMLGKNQALINSWVTSCDDNHGERCNVCHDDKFYDLVESSYFGVIDVRDLKLDRLQGGQSYAALSYVWGKGKKFTTLLENVLLHRTHGGIESNLERLPNAIKDAIEVCRKLQIRYLWVDSLCIVQDSKRSWRLNAAAMDVIYGNAHLTICAADGIDASAGLTAIRNNSPRERQPTAELDGMTLTFTKLAEAGIQKSEWNKRAWTFCERMLSKRCLIFNQGHVFFQCRSTAMSEDIVAEPKGAGWSLGLVDAPLQLLRELKPQKRPFWVYTECVRLYMKRQLTFNNDILHAFAGMSNLLSNKMGAQMLFGLPNTHFDLALLWVQTGAMKQRRPKTFNDKRRRKTSGDKVKAEAAKRKVDDDKKRWGEDEFPSWSWCGWQARKHASNASIEYDLEMLDGCLRNINEWLSKHTWIHWYIRDGYSNLRKVFEAEDARDVSIGEDAAITRRLERSVSPSVTDRYDEESSSEGSITPALDRKIEKEVQKRTRKELEKRQIADEKQKIRKQQERRHMATSVKGSLEGLGDRKETKTREEGYATTKERRAVDPEYGRLAHSDIMEQEQDQFTKTIPEYPFNVNKADRGSEPSVEFPDQRYLQFWTWSAGLRLVPHDNPDAQVPQGLTRYDIADGSGDWVGTIVLDDQEMRTEQSRRHPHDTKYEFLALSEAKGFTEQEYPVWTYYIPKERNQSQWDAYFVMMVTRGRGGIARRLGLGKVFKAAFDNSCGDGKDWKEIILQ